MNPSQLNQFPLAILFILKKRTWKAAEGTEGPSPRKKSKKRSPSMTATMPFEDDQPVDTQEQIVESPRWLVGLPLRILDKLASSVEKSPLCSLALVRQS